MKTKMAFTNRLIATLLSFVLLLQPLCCSELFSWETAYHQLDDIEQSLNDALNLNKQLENKNKQLENQVSNLDFKVQFLDKQILNWENSYNLQNKEYQRVLQQSKTLEKQCNFWKTSTMICGAGLLTSITTLVIAYRIQRKSK